MPELGFDPEHWLQGPWLTYSDKAKPATLTESAARKTAQGRPSLDLGASRNHTVWGAWARGPGLIRSHGWALLCMLTLESVVMSPLAVLLRLPPSSCLGFREM